MLGLKRVHHIAIIATDYARSKAFYCDILGFTLQSEFYRAERDSWKGDLALNGEYVIELFSFPFPPARPSRPEACGLRHLAFSVDDIDAAVAHLEAHGVAEAIRVDPFTGKRFTFLTIRTTCRWKLSAVNLASAPWPGNVPGHHFSVCS
jgi:glyoxylase I family protein